MYYFYEKMSLKSDLFSDTQCQLQKMIILVAANSLKPTQNKLRSGVTPSDL